MSTQTLPTPLSKRELEILDLSFEGFTDKEICRKLGITLATIRTHWVRLRQKQGSVNRAQAIAMAMSEAYRKTSAELRKSEQKFRAIFESVSGHAIFTMDAERHVTSWGPGAEEILGYTEAEMLGQSADVIFTPEDREAAAPDAEGRTAAEGGRAADERWHVRKDGRRFWATGYVSPLWDVKGALQGYIKVMRDDTERHQAEVRLRNFLRQSEEGITCFELREPVPLTLPEDVLLDRIYAQAIIAECNPSLADMCGYGSCEQMVGKPIGELVVRDDPTNEQTLRHLVETGFRASDMPTNERDPKGALRPFTNRVTGTVEAGLLTQIWLVQTPIPA